MEAPSSRPVLPPQRQEQAHAVVSWGGTAVHLLPSHAAWWPDGAVLFVADLHLGKAASFRKSGQPVPGGSTQDNFGRIDGLIAALAPRRIVFLGDFLHARAGHTAALRDALQRWRMRHAGIAMTLVRGNHDRHAGDPLPEAGIDCVDEPWLLGPFACCHHPQPHASHFVLAGHDHPVVHLSGPAHEHLRLPCFASDAAHAVLPAFGAFTGGHPVRPGGGRVIHAVGGGRVWLLPASRHGARAVL